MNETLRGTHMACKTSLHASHLKAAARMVDFSGWEMPLHYGSQINEHHAVRREAGLFDVSHMGMVDFIGKDALPLLRHLLSADVARLPEGAGLYCCLLNPEGGIMDDLIAYRQGEDHFRLVVNAGTREKDITWFREHARGLDVSLTERTDLAMLALQGPKVRESLPALLPEPLKAAVPLLPAFAITTQGDWTVARTGYTGEEGFEIMLPASEAPLFWETLIAAGIQPCGLGARDTLRLEAGLNLYGADMDESVSPFESGLGWTVHLDPLDRHFIGREALIARHEKGITEKRVGVVADARTVLRSHQTIDVTPSLHGIITSGSFSPTLGIGIGLARVPLNAGSSGNVTVRGKTVPVSLMRPPFVRHGNKCF